MIRIIDNFCTDPDAVRLSAIQSGFGTWKPNKGEVGSSNYEGMSFWGKHALMLSAHPISPPMETTYMGLRLKR